MTGLKSINGINLRDAARDVVHFLEPYHDHQLLSPVIILAFDEGHELTEVQGNANQPWSRFGELRCIIRKLKSLPILSLFISTMSKLSEFPPAPRQFSASERIVNETLALLPPFTELGFDQLLHASPIIENKINIQDATTDGFMCQFGPLFVAISYSLFY